VTYRGTVVAVEDARVQVKTIDAKTKKEETRWFGVSKQTVTKRGTTTVPYASAKIVNGERIVLIVVHEAEASLAAKEIRLAAAK
jgi:hypothetical protein